LEIGKWGDNFFYLSNLAGFFALKLRRLLISRFFRRRGGIGGAG
jgi:hypothetical protein